MVLTRMKALLDRPELFDAYQAFRPEPAALFALSVVRKPTRRVATLFAGGYIASGTPTPDRQPSPYLPEGLRTLGLEGAGEELPGLGVPPLLQDIAFDALIADKAFDSNAIIADLDARGAKVVISQHPRRTSPRTIDQEMYKWRHLIENFFAKLKEFKRIAMRSDKTDASFGAMIHLSAAVINSR